MQFFLYYSGEFLLLNFLGANILKLLFVCCFMNLVFVGPQASGKGTQAKIISEKLGIVHISAGDLLRREKGKLMEKIHSYIDFGKLVPDELIIKILKKRISKDDAKKGFILDGFPRNLVQARELKKIAKIDKFVEIFISDELAIKRLSGRFNCENCGALYNTFTSPKPKKEGICDKCGGKLYRRKDDTEEAIKKRLETYHKETEPILEKYSFVRVDGSASIEEVSKEIIKKCNCSE